MANDENNVWGVLGNLAEKIIDNRTRTNAAPQGAPAASAGNPFFDYWGAYPQAENKAQPGAVSFSLASFGPWLWVLGAVALIAIFARR